MNYNFPKSEKVVSLKIISALFAKGSHGIFVFPYKITVIKLQEQQESNCQVLIIVPKRNFKKAVDRNKIKRQTREIYRLNKHLLLNANALKTNQIAISIAYIAKESNSYKMAEIALIKALKLIAEYVEKSSPNSFHPVN